MSALPIIEPAPSDAELIACARAGSDDAFTELYERHAAAAQAAARALTRSKATAEDLVAEGFTRLLGALRNGAGPEVAFRPYLLACVRNAFYDRTRKDNRVDWSQDVEAAVPADSLALLDPNMDPEERHLIARAFTTLPERWQLVLWHTEVEGRQPADVAPLLGLAPNAVAALAYRAREGLRKAYLQAHLQAQPPDECRFTRERLGAYVRDGVNPREREQIEEHLDHCDDCKAMYLELVDVDSTLRRALIPLVIGVGPAAYLKLIGGGGIVKWVSRSSRAQAAVAAVTVAAVVSGAVLVATATDRDQNVEAIAPTSVERTTTTRAGLGTIAPPTRRPSTSTGSIPTLTVPPTVITVNRPPSPGRGSSTVAPGATVVPTVITPPRQTTTTRRPATTSTTRKPTTTTTVKPTTTLPPSTIGTPDDRPPSSTIPGGGGPIVTPAPPSSSPPTSSTPTPPPPGPTTPVLRSNGNPTFETPAELYAGDTVLVNVPVVNDGASGSPSVNLSLQNASPPPVPAGGPGNAPRIPRQAAPGTCTHVGGGQYICQTIEAGASTTLQIPIVLGGRGLPLIVSSDVSGSLPLNGYVVKDPITSTATFTPFVESVPNAGTLAVTVKNVARSVTSPASDVNPLKISAPSLASVMALDAQTAAACGLIENLPQPTSDPYDCPSLSVGAGGDVTLSLALFGVDEPSVPFPVAVKVGTRTEFVAEVQQPPPVTPQGLKLRYTGVGQVDVRSPDVTPTAPAKGRIAYAALVWRGSDSLTVSEGDERETFSGCDQTLEGVSLHSCEVTGNFDPFVAVITSDPPNNEWRLLIVTEHPAATQSVEVFSRADDSAVDENHYLLDTSFSGAPLLGVLGFGGPGGAVMLTASGQTCQVPNPFNEAFTARLSIGPVGGCSTEDADIRVDVVGPAAIVPKMFIIQRPA